MTGVVNVITLSPRELAATGRGESLTIGAGFFDRDATGVDNGTGGLFYVNGTHAQAVNDKWAYKLSAGYFSQDPLPRPTGTIPNSFNTPYPPYTNKGTAQPRFDARVDYALDNSATLVFSGGVAGTEGMPGGAGKRLSKYAPVGRWPNVKLPSAPIGLSSNSPSATPDSTAFS